MFLWHYRKRVRARSIRTPTMFKRGEVAVDIPDESLSQELLKVLSMYVRDMREKLSLFDADLRKIELIQQMTNRRFLY